MATFRSKLLDFLQVLHINCQKFELRGPWPGNLGRLSGALGIPGDPWLPVRAPGLLGCRLEAPGPLVVN